MNAGRNKSHTDGQPPRPMDTGNAPHSRGASGSSAAFNTRNVTREEDLPCKLTVYLDYGHSFVRLENKERGVNIARGLYPYRPHVTIEQEVSPLEMQEESDELEKHSAYTSLLFQEVKPASSVSERAILSVNGSSEIFRGLYSYEDSVHVLDEVESYKDLKGIDHIPKVTFFISRKEALDVEKYISQYTDACEKKEESCLYKLIGFNCIDFAQEVFSKTGYPGHYIQYFTPSLLAHDCGYATLYAAGCHPVVKNTASIGGTLMLAVVVGKYAVPKMKETARMVGSWMCGWVWPEQPAVAAKQEDVNELKQLHSSVKSTNLFCETFWEGCKERDAQAKRLISDSIDLQARFDDLEELIKTEGYRGRNQSFIYEELQSIQDGFTEFFKQATDMKSAKNSKE
ncbi:hypothetical protein [Endozoicomonas sp. SESOKO2]|uniref:hypothetical protein n=1 Tax=Endozoicomonas sp. SESOKO2 TaxID=2828743 RepID=UPI0021471D70|nr:hypothetical protein [Endozoicomonas sp. SESOKO2]